MVPITILSFERWLDLYHQSELELSSFKKIIVQLIAALLIDRNYKWSDIDFISFYHLENRVFHLVGQKRFGDLTFFPKKNNSILCSSFPVFICSEIQSFFCRFWFLLQAKNGTNKRLSSCPFRQQSLLSSCYVGSARALS